MQCGAEDTLCQFMALIVDNELAAGTVATLLGHLGAHAQGIIGNLFALLKEHGEKLIGIAGFVFGVFRWWKYREHILHKRLQEYLKDNDRRLRDGQNYVLEALQRPTPGKPFKTPLFAGRELQWVLTRRNWDRTVVAATFAGSADRQLEKAKAKVERRLEAAQAASASMRQELATTHLLRGAIAAASAAGPPPDSVERNSRALGYFRDALQVPGHQASVLAKEFEAHQLRKLGDLPGAAQAFSDLEQLASSVGDYRSQRLMIARAKRYRAEILQVIASLRLVDGSLQFHNCAGAYNLLAPNVADSALAIRLRFAPFQGWELLEHGDIHYLTAFVSRNCGSILKEKDRLNDAQSAFQGVLAATEKRIFRQSCGSKRLSKLAKDGLERVSRARQGVYETDWLVGQSQKPKQPAASVTNA